jgi:hypothetical protein
MEVGDLHVGKQLQVVSNLPGGVPGPPNIAHGAGVAAIPGAVWFDGSLHVGAPLFAPGETEVGFCRPPASNTKAFANSIKSIFAISGRGGSNGVTDVVVGDPIGPVGISVNAALINILSPITNGVGVLNWTGTKSFIGVKQQTGVELRAGAVADFGKESTIGNVVESGARIINGSLVVNGPTRINGFLSFSGSIVGTTKKFDISHPTKPNHRLAHACIEGPENGVYYRGRLTDNNVIQLPEYWQGLIDPETITVNLTPHRVYQELFVKSIEWVTKINIVNNSGGPIDCSYTIYAKRKDVEDLVVEYEGNESKHWDLKGK